MSKLNIYLTEWQARIVLQALDESNEKWRHANRTTQDEDEQADYANDLIELNTTKRHITEAAAQTFGASFSSNGIAVPNTVPRS